MKRIFGNLLFLLCAPIFAQTTASVTQTWFYPGDQIIFTLTSDGDNVIFPTIDDIAGQSILYTSNAQKTNIVNGNRYRESSRSYILRPSKSLIIPAYTVIVDDNKHITQPIKITLKKPSVGKSGDDYILQIIVDKTEFFLGDKAKLQVILKEKKSLSSNNKIRISMPEVKDLLFVKDNKTTRSADKNYNIHTLNYTLNADNFGIFNIPSFVATINAQNNTVFGNFFSIRQNKQSKKIYSNPLTLKVKSLPNALRVFGNFSIKATVDKTQVKEGDVINLTVFIKGKGNFEDIEAFKFEINNATIYTDDAVSSYKDWQQKFAIVGEKNFVIPSFKLDYFDKKTQTKKTIHTQLIPIQVEQDASVVKTTTFEPSKNTGNAPVINPTLKYYYLLLGTIIGLLIGISMPTFKRKKQQQSLIKKIKSVKGNKALFDLLIPLNLTELEEVLRQLEDNLYKGATHKINKKDILAIINKQANLHNKLDML